MGRARALLGGDASRIHVDALVSEFSLLDLEREDEEEAGGTARA